jgi:hypothetical protein
MPCSKETIIEVWITPNEADDEPIRMATYRNIAPEEEQHKAFIINIDLNAITDFPGMASASEASESMVIFRVEVISKRDTGIFLNLLLVFVRGGDRLLLLLALVAASEELEVAIRVKVQTRVEGDLLILRIR